MLDYRCNLEGCCCKGWQIHFRDEDLARLADHLPAEELQDAIARGLICVLDEEAGVVDHFRLRFRELSPGEPTCRFLHPDGGCALHARFGVDALPGLCVDFPVVAAELGDALELSFSPLCPAVLDAIFAGAGPYELVSVSATEPLLQRRLERVRPVGELTLGGVELSADALRTLRGRVLSALDDVERPALEHLQAIGYGLAFVMNTADPEAFELRYDMPALPFVRFFHQAMQTHSGTWLARSLRSYRRFLFEPRVVALLDGCDDDDLAGALDEWEGELLSRLAPAEPALRGGMNRFLAHRYFSSLVAFKGEVLLALGRVVRVFATALRIAVALAARLGEPTVDADLLSAALGASAYLHHNDALPATSAVWFVPEHFGEG